MTPTSAIRPAAASPPPVRPPQSGNLYWAAAAAAASAYWVGDQIASQGGASTALNQVTAVGSQAGLHLLANSGSTLIGYKAGVSLTTGGGNSALGNQAALFLTTGINNTILGAAAGQGMTRIGIRQRSPGCERNHRKWRRQRGADRQRHQRRERLVAVQLDADHRWPAEPARRRGRSGAGKRLHGGSHCRQ